MSGNIVIHTLRCGTMRVLPRERYIADRGLLRERIELPVNAYLIEHPKHGRILLDTGGDKRPRADRAPGASAAAVNKVL